MYYSKKVLVAFLAVLSMANATVNYQISASFVLNRFHFDNCLTNSTIAIASTLRRTKIVAVLAVASNRRKLALQAVAQAQLQAMTHFKHYSTNYILRNRIWLSQLKTITLSLYHIR